MNAKNNRTNTDFQIAYFIAGSCQTADGAYALLKAQEQLKVLAIKTADASELKVRSTIQCLTLLKWVGLLFPPLRMYAMGRLAEIEAHKEVARANYAGALAELEFMRKCLERIEPLRKFSHLPDPEAFEASQRDEWKLSLIRQAENHLISNGAVPADQFNAMRMHPDFKTEIYPAIEKMKKERFINIEQPELQKLLNG